MILEVTVARESRAHREYYRLMWATIEHGTGTPIIDVSQTIDTITFTLEADNLSSLIKEYISSDKGAL